VKPLIQASISASSTEWHAAGPTIVAVTPDIGVNPRSDP